MKSSFLVVMFLLSVLYLQGQSFTDLSTYQKFGSEIKYNPKYTELVNKTLDDGYVTYYVMKTKINISDDTYFKIVFDEGPSADPGYWIYKLETGGTETEMGHIPGEVLIIPGNGSIYVSGRANNLYTKKQKYTIDNSQLTETKQGAYYIGHSGKTRELITLYAQKNNASKVAVLPKDYDIEVVIEQDGWFLMKTPFGLTGWVSEKSLVTYGPELSITGFYFAGD